MVIHHSSPTIRLTRYYLKISYFFPYVPLLLSFQFLLIKQQTHPTVFFLKIIPNNRAVFHTPCSIFFIRHIGKIRLHNSGDSVMGNPNVSFSFRFFLDIIKKIIDPAAWIPIFRNFARSVSVLPDMGFLSSQKSTVPYLLPG